MGQFHTQIVALIMLIFEWLINTEILLWFIGCCMVITAFDLLKKLLNW